MRDAVLEDLQQPRSVPHTQQKLLQDQTDRDIEQSRAQFLGLIRGYSALHLVFLSLILLEVILFVAFFTWLLQASVVAISLAVIVLTLFSYGTLRLYFQTQKPFKLARIKDDYIAATKHLMDYDGSTPQHLMALANSCTHFASLLQGSENSCYVMPSWMGVLTPYVRKITSWLHYEDVLAMRELLLSKAIEEHIKLVKCEPTSLEMHTALANSYVTLSSLFMDPHKGHRDDCGASSLQEHPQFKAKFRIAAERAIEEFKILNDYAPNDPWIHMQLAYSYRDLGMPEQETRQYEIILKLRPNDPETLIRLGRLYFQQGYNSKGLRIYEALLNADRGSAEELIGHYGEYTP